MKHHLLHITSVAIIGGCAVFGIAEAQQLTCNGQRPRCASGNTASCIDMRGAYMPNDPPQPGWHCPEWPMPSGAFTGGRDNEKNKAPEPEKNNPINTLPCNYNIEQIVRRWTGQKPALPAFTAARAVAKPKGFLQSFMQGFGILPGDNVYCPVVFTPAAQKFDACNADLENAWRRNNPVVAGDRTYIERLNNARKGFINECRALLGEQAYKEWQSPERTCPK